MLEMPFASPQRIGAELSSNLGTGHTPLAVESVAQTMQSDREPV